MVPFAAAARGGQLDGLPASRLVSAGIALLQRSGPLVRALHKHRSGILLPTSAQFLTALAASTGRGAVLMNPLASRPELLAQVDDAGVGAVFTVRELADRLPPALPRVLLDNAPEAARVILAGDEHVIPLESHDGIPLTGDADAEGSPDEAGIVYTSAMAGRPLGAILTHDNLLGNARATIVAGGISADEHSLALLPFSHLFGLVVACLAPLLAGGRVSCMPRFHPVRTVERLEAGDITLLVGVPAVFGAILNVLVRRGSPLRAPSLRLCICGGAPLPIAWQDQWVELTGVELRQGYGLSEAGPVCLFNRVDRPNERGTMGTPFPGVEVAIYDPGKLSPLGVGETGEIWVRGPNVSPGYVGDARSGLERHGAWLRTGDLAVRNAEGSFTFAGLRKAMFTRSGFNIYPRELELAVAELDGVHAARVSALPSPGREHEIAIEVTGRVTEAQVRAWCEERLSAYKQPSEVRVHVPDDERPRVTSAPA